MERVMEDPDPRRRSETQSCTKEEPLEWRCHGRRRISFSLLVPIPSRPTSSSKLGLLHGWLFNLIVFVSELILHFQSYRFCFWPTSYRCAVSRHQEHISNNKSKFSILMVWYWSSRWTLWRASFQAVSSFLLLIGGSVMEIGRWDSDWRMVRRMMKGGGNWGAVRWQRWWWFRWPLMSFTNSVHWWFSKLETLWLLKQVDEKW